MATRFRLWQNSAPITPSGWDSGWDATLSGSMTAFPQVTVPYDAPNNSTSSVGTGTNPSKKGLFRFVSKAPLAAQTISGTIKGQIRANETNTTDNYTTAIAVRILKPDGTERAVLLSATASDNTSATPPEMATTLTNRRFQDAAESASLSLTSGDALDGDYLCIEVGFRQASTSTASITLSVTPVDGDLPEDDTTTTNLAAWVEFSNDIEFQKPTYYGSSVSNPTDNNATGANEPGALSVTPPSGMVAGDLVLLVGQLQVATTGQITVSETGGQSWSLAGEQAGNDQVAALYWAVFNGTWSADPSLNFAAQSGTQPSTVVMHVFRAPAGAIDWTFDSFTGANFAAPSSPFTVTITGVTPGGNYAAVLAGWFSADDNTWSTHTGTNWDAVGLAQYRNLAGTDQSCTFAQQTQITAAATNNVSKNQATLGGDAGVTFIASFLATVPDIPLPTTTDGDYQDAVLEPLLDMSFYTAVEGPVGADFIEPPLATFEDGSLPPVDVLEEDYLFDAASIFGPVGADNWPPPATFDDGGYQNDVENPDDISFITVDDWAAWDDIALELVPTTETEEIIDEEDISYVTASVQAAFEDVLEPPLATFEDEMIVDEEDISYITEDQQAATEDFIEEMPASFTGFDLDAFIHHEIEIDLSAQTSQIPSDGIGWDTGLSDVRITISEERRRIDRNVTGTNAYAGALSEITHTGGKYYVEATIVRGSDVPAEDAALGIAQNGWDVLWYLGRFVPPGQLESVGYYGSGSVWWHDFEFAQGNPGKAYSTDEVIGMAVDLFSGQVWFRDAGGWVPDINGNVGDPAAGTYPTMTFAAGLTYRVAATMYDGVGPNTPASRTNFGQAAFFYGAPAGFLAWHTPEQTASPYDFRFTDGDFLPDIDEIMFVTASVDAPVGADAAPAPSGNRNLLMLVGHGT